MSCCENKDKNESDIDHEKNHKGHKSHLLMMALCCGAPILLLILLPIIGGFLSPNARNSLISIIPFLCPIMMIPMMMKGNKKRVAERNHPKSLEN